MNEDLTPLSGLIGFGQWKEPFVEPDSLELEEIRQRNLVIALRMLEEGMDKVRAELN